MPVTPPRLPTLLAALAFVACAGAAAGLPGPVAARPLLSSPAPARSSTRPSDDLALLQDAAADAATRAAAARRLIAATDTNLQVSIAAILTPAATLAESRAIFLRELRTASNLPTWLVPPLAKLAAESPPAEQPAILDALGSIRSRESIRALLPFTTPPSPGPVRASAFAALTRLTGRADLGTDAEAWRTWFADLEWRPEAEWLRILNEGLASGFDRAARDRDRWIARTVEAERRAFVEGTQAAARSAALAGFLRDDLAPLRRLGVELLNRELANARVPDESVSLLTLNLLRDPYPDLRQAGAELVSVLNPMGAPAALTNALLNENDPGVAAALLRSAALAPSAAIRPVVMRWIATPGPAQFPAMDAASALIERALVDVADMRDAILAALRQSDLNTLPASGLRLLASLGGDDDRVAVASQLASPTPARRIQAAEALAPHATFLSRLTDAARHDAALFLTTCRAIAAHNATVNGYLIALDLTAISEETRRGGLLLIIERMDRRDLLTAARLTENLPLRELVLARLTATPLRAPIGDAGPIGPEPTVIGGLLLLADTRLQLRQPAGALAAIEALAPVRDAVDPEDCDRIKTICLLWLNRINEAAALPSPLSAWLDGLERCIDLAHAPDVLAAIDSRFATPLNPDLARLTLLRSRIASEMGPPAPQLPAPSTTAAPTGQTPSPPPPDPTRTTAAPQVPPPPRR